LTISNIKVINNLLTNNIALPVFLKGKPISTGVLVMITTTKVFSCSLVRKHGSPLLLPISSPSMPHSL
jgi:hypothetical protein